MPFTPGTVPASVLDDLKSELSGRIDELANKVDRAVELAEESNKKADRAIDLAVQTSRDVNIAIKLAEEAKVSSNALSTEMKNMRATVEGMTENVTVILEILKPKS